MPVDLSNTNSATNAPTSKSATTKGATTDKKAVVAHLKTLQDKIWAIMGLKMAVDKLRDLKYDVVVAEDAGGCTSIKISLGVNFDMATGLIEGKDIMAVETELEKQIAALEGKK